MLLHNLLVPGCQDPVSIGICGKKIGMPVSEPGGQERVELSFESAICFPGLINSHDHLDFNCFSPFGNRVYRNYTEWGRHIHADYKPEINRIMAIPQALRIKWGIYKNLMDGVTTVLHHGEKIKAAGVPITIHQRVQNLHSVAFEKKWKQQLNHPFFQHLLCVMHVGEGTDEQASGEIDSLIKWNLFQRKLVGVHGVAMSREQAASFEALVWCPESNRVLLNRQPSIAALSETTRIVFGTDSTLTGRRSIWDHLRFARELNIIPDESLFETTTSSPASLWKLNKGVLQSGYDADLVIASVPRGSGWWDGFFGISQADILLVIHEGRVRLFDDSIRQQVKPLINEVEFSRAVLPSGTKWVEGDWPALVKQIEAYYPEHDFINATA